MTDRSQYRTQIRTKSARPPPPAVRRFAAAVLSDLAKRTKYVDPGLAARWPALVGEEIAALCRPGRLTGGRTGRTLEVVAPHGAAAARVSLEAETIMRKVNDFLGPGAVARIAIQQAGGAAPKAADGRDSAASGSLGSALSRFRASVAAREGKET